MKDRAIPKYQTVHDAILTRLLAGHYTIGTRLPTEEVLSKTFEVSRVTIRKALDLLVRAGYLTAKQGSGYVVSTLSPPSSTCMASFTDQVLNEGRIPGAKLLSVDNPAQYISTPVQQLFSEPLILVQRLRTVDDLPRMFTQTWIPVRLAPACRRLISPRRVRSNRSCGFSVAVSVWNGRRRAKRWIPSSPIPILRAVWMWPQHADPVAGLHGVRHQRKTGVFRSSLPPGADQL